MDQKYTVSARKFRPQTFSQIIGQQHIVRTLTNALDKQRIAHAYLFSGTRGVGKTTTARILAKALNCVKGPTSSPCLTCDNCLEITNGSSLDVIEIDGASNTGIDNIRELRENAKFTPSKSHYKIYIIDEVHQISKAAFNALLKTLEEPPKHVVFIFATTELNKVPDTILSRCQSFEYKSISLKDIEIQLQMIAKNEGIEATTGAIELLARRARGSMRDAQSLFDQTAAYGGGSVSEDDVKLILGMVDKSTLFAVVDAAIRQDKAKLLDISDEISYSGSDPALFCEELADTAKNIMSVKIRPHLPPPVEQDEAAKLMEWAAALDYDEIQRFFDVLIETMDQMRRSHQPSINLAMGLLKLTEKRGLVKIDALIEEVAKTQTLIERETASQRTVVSGSRPAARTVVDENITLAPPEIEQAMFESVPPKNMVSEFIKVKPMLAGFLTEDSLVVRNGVVTIKVHENLWRETIEEPETKKNLEDIATRVMGAKTRIVVLIDDEKKKENDSLKRQKEKNNDAVQKYIYNMPIIQSALNIFNDSVFVIKADEDK